MNASSLLFLFSVIAVSSSPVLLHAATTIGDALDAAHLVWTTGGTDGIGWTYRAGNGAGNDTFDGVASAQSGRIADNAETWIQTSVVGPGTISFWWKAYSEPNADWLEFHINATRKARICGFGDDWSSWPSEWEYHSLPVPAGTNVLRWRYVKDSSSTGGTLDYGLVDRVSYVTSPPPPLQLALNTCGVAWTSAGSLYPNGWFAQTNVTRDGHCAAQSGAIWHNQTNWLQTTISGVTNVSFWWKVSSQTNADFLQFHTNGVLAKQVSGEINWQSNTFALPAKTNTLEWRYVKNGEIVAGSDCGWLDQVAFGPRPKALPFTLLPPIRQPDGHFQIQIVGEAGCPCRVEVSSDPTPAGTWSELVNQTTSGLNTLVTDPGASNSPIRFYRAASP